MKCPPKKGEKGGIRIYFSGYIYAFSKKILYLQKHILC